MDPGPLIRGWQHGRAQVGADGELVLAPAPPTPLRDRARLAYSWLTERALRVSHRDLCFGDPEPARGGLPAESYASFALLPLLALFTSQRLLFVGAPGRGKTTMATLVGLVAGIPSRQMRQAVQHGHPQLTVADLLGAPLPSELLRASQTDDVRVAWRRWLTLRVKVIDEYNRIPTKTQSALLSLMAEGYAEQFEQTVEVGRSAWFLTANDDEGGGTFPVIEALKDRIDLVVRCAPISSRELDVLADRVAEGRAAPVDTPADIVFSGADLDAAEAEIRAVPLADGVLDVLGFFTGQLDFCLRASDRPERRTKDALHVAGRRVAAVCTEDCPLDKQVHLCTRTERGVSARAVQAILLTAKGLAWFRGAPAVTVAEVRQALPWVLHDKLAPNAQSPWFQQEGHEVLLLDRPGFHERLFDDALVMHAAHAPARAEARRLRDLLAHGPDGRSASDLDALGEEIGRAIAGIEAASEPGGALHDDLLLLRELSARCADWAKERRG